MTTKKMIIEFTKQTDEHYKKLIKSGQKKVLEKLVQLFEELENHPRSGTGKPERLKHQGEGEVWSRRIDRKNRLVYIIIEEQVVVLVISILGHYEDK